MMLSLLRDMRFGVWDPQENPGHRPKNRPIAFACDYNYFQIFTSTMSFARKKEKNHSRFFSKSLTQT